MVVAPQTFCGLRSLCAAAERRVSSLSSQSQCGWLLELTSDGWLQDRCIPSVGAHWTAGLRTSSTGPSLSIACRLLPPQYR